MVLILRVQEISTLPDIHLPFIDSKRLTSIIATMFTTKTLLSILLLASGLVTATNTDSADIDTQLQAPVAPQPPIADSATCQLIATQTGDHVGDALQGTVNYTIGRTIGVHYVGKKIRGMYTIATDPVADDPLLADNDSKLTIDVTVSVDGVEAGDIARLIRTWKGKELEGLNRTRLTVRGVECS